MVNIIVCIKRVPDTESKINIASDGRSIDNASLEYIVNPYDEFAVEEAIKTVEAQGGEVTVICLGPKEATKEIRTCLAMGADKAVHLVDDAPYRDAYSVASILSSAIKELEYDILFFGKQGVDYDNNQVGIMAATLLGIPAVGEVVSFELDNGKATVKREIEGGSEILQVPLPAAFTAQKGLNEPRYASLKGIMKAKKKPLEEKAFDSVDSRITIKNLEPPPKRPPGKMVGEGKAAAPELVRLLKEEAKIL
ncbi:MAG: electron transfer flavoprotein subunit beta/FixA family protein [Planctomycetota bacterium]